MSLFFTFLSISAPVADTASRVVSSARQAAELTAGKEKFWLVDDFWQFMVRAGFGERIADLVAFMVACLVLAAVVWLIDKLVVKISLHAIKRATAKTQTDLDDIFVNRKFFSRLFQMLPLSVVLYLSNKIFAGFSADMIMFVDSFVKSCMIFLGLLICYSLLGAWNDIYNRNPQAVARSIKGYIQVAKIIMGFIAGILIVATLIQRDPTTLFVGLGTAAALLSLVFRDTILGFVASIQLSAQDMVRIGDWITMPSKNADGTVTDINVNSVKVRNWDNTITMIPIYSMVSDSFTNWRAMEQSDGRRMVRFININIESVKFADENFLAKMSHKRIVESHFEQMLALAEESSPGETLTNLALLRAHIDLFLQNHSGINEDLPLYVRYKQEISDKGIGIEIYAFSREKGAKGYDSVVRSVMEYVIASAPLFDIVLFQSPSGEDFKKIVE